MPTQPLRIVADANIPLVSEAFGRLGEIETYAAAALTREVVAKADVLLVRSVTRVDAALLEGSAVR
ncbi:MAG TPA: 4-phosphoerythronate dehydrogenase, partial [Rhodothermales bacterium]|nr:4-phosphoerythronate dehydrogenase [Rhodothermales bacterium]